MRLAVLAFAIALGTTGCPKEGRGPTFAPEAVTSRPLRLQFTPPDGRLLHERSVTTRSDSAGAETVEATITSRYDRQQQGWLLTQWVPQVKVTRNQAVVPPLPLMDLVSKFPLKIQLAEDGAFIQFKNPQDAEAAIRTTYETPEAVAQVAAFFTPEAIEKQARREWEDKYAGLLNRNLAVGETFYSLDAFTTADGMKVRYVIERKLTGVSPSAHGNAVVLTMRCLGKAEEVAQIPAAVKLLEASGEMALEPTVTCDGQQLIAISPFVPVKRWTRVSAQPKSADGTSVDVTLSREVSVLRLEETR